MPDTENREVRITLDYPFEHGEKDIHELGNALIEQFEVKYIPVGEAGPGPFAALTPLAIYATLSPAAIYLGKKALDSAIDLVKTWLMAKPEEYKRVNIYGPDGEVISVVKVKKDVQIEYSV
jgi:hypothetical protein